MIDSNIAKREGRGEYLINARIFGRGNWQQIKQAMLSYERLQIQVTIDQNGSNLDTLILKNK